MTPKQTKGTAIDYWEELKLKHKRRKVYEGIEARIMV